ncbi:asparaginase [Roseibium sp. CAU 1637]|uniref:Asparaginase n=1 Tax=Roseibium limicola TaxID=2816037 RepID=A0A939J9D4_9HYPH|nr:asparaginase [Roseibium limicola]MBO0345278.1 asparaginase [Roseibium limicola]
MSNPITVEVSRGDLVESRHHGFLSVVTSAGKEICAIGDTTTRVFPRSAIKVLQALPLVESGAADALDFDDAELALACASHNGENVHVKTARIMLMKAGLTEDDLECGTQWPSRVEDIAELVRADETPTGLHNNCSGKHAAFLGLARTLGVQTKGYVDASHPVQQEIKTVIEAFTCEEVTQDVCGIDGCSIPTYAVPLKGWARAFAVFGTGEGLDEDRLAACDRLFEACVSEPFMVAGSDRFCTDVMSAFEGRVFVKTGAEGVFCASIPELELGIALKAEDGATRASEAMMGAVLEVLLPDRNEAQFDVLQRYTNPPIKTRRDVVAGEIRPTAEFVTALHEQLS